MGRTELPWLIAGRHVRPYAFAVSLATANLAAIILTNRSVWGTPGDAWSLVVAAVAIGSTVLLWAGFWLRHSALMEHGLLLSVAVFTARGVYIGLVGGSGAWWTAGLSFAWGIASGGAWLLERTTGGHYRDEPAADDGG